MLESTFGRPEKRKKRKISSVFLWGLVAVPHLLVESISGAVPRCPMTHDWKRSTSTLAFFTIHRFFTPHAQSTESIHRHDIWAAAQALPYSLTTLCPERAAGQVSLSSTPRVFWRARSSASVEVTNSTAFVGDTHPSPPEL